LPVEGCRNCERNWNLGIQQNLKLGAEILCNTANKYCFFVYEEKVSVFQKYQFGTLTIMRSIRTAVTAAMMHSGNYKTVLFIFINFPCYCYFISHCTSLCRLFEWDQPHQYNLSVLVFSNSFIQIITFLKML
jgi:hypothetical protein